MSKIKGPAMGRRTAAAIAAEIEAFDAERGPAAEALDRERAARPALVAAGDLDGIEALDAKVRRAEIEAEVHASRRTRLVAEMEGAASAEAHAAEQATRRAAYDEARAAADEAARLYREEYPRLARAIADLLRRTATAGNLVKAANAAFPEDVERIADPEPSRGRPSIDTPGETQFKTVRRDRRTGLEVHHWHPGDPNIEEVRVECGKGLTTFSPAVPHVPLRHAVNLPGVAYGDPAFWAAPTPQAPPGAVAGITDWRQLAR
jgi:hypothetical protein